MHSDFGFTKNGNIYRREYPQGASIEVNFDTQKITYAPVDSLFKEGEFPSKDKPSKGFVIHRDTTLSRNICIIIYSRFRLKILTNTKDIISI